MQDNNFSERIESLEDDMKIVDSNFRIGLSLLFSSILIGGIIIFLFLEHSYYYHSCNYSSKAHEQKVVITK